MPLVRYTLNRLMMMGVTIAVLVPLTFLLFRLVPGDPSAAVIGPNLDPSVRDVLRERYGVDDPLAVQLVKYLGLLAQGDLGVSFQYKRPVGEILAGKLFNTAVLVVPAITLALVLGVAIGALLAATRHEWLDRAVRNVVFAVKAAPIFWTASLAVLLFSLRLDWLPSVGMRTPGSGDSPSGLATVASPDFLWHLILPLTVITLFVMPEPLLTMRTAMKENLHEDFIELGRAQGLSRTRIIYRHAARNGLLPVVTLMPALTGLLIGGQVIVETVFSWPGMGREIVNAVNTYDYPVMQGVFLLTGLLAVSINTVVDILYAYLDPRVRLT